MAIDERRSSFSRAGRIPPELLVLPFLLGLFNLHLLPGSSVAPLHFHPQPVLAGAWWRLLTHPFVHVSLYHLVLDAAAFVVLYATLAEYGARRRLAFAAGSAVGSLAGAVLLSPDIARVGLCGLSGAAHGLMAIAGIEMLRREPRDAALQRIGWLTLASVTAKAFYEAVTGVVLFASLHPGALGTPQAACHLGGVVGGAAAYWLLAGGAGVSRSCTSARPPTPACKTPRGVS